MENSDIQYLIKILTKEDRSDISQLLERSYSKVNESTAYGSRLYSTLSSFEIYSPFENNQKLNKLPEEDKKLLLDCVRLIYPLKDESPEIVNIEFFLDIKLELNKENEFVKSPELAFTSEVVSRAIKDAETLIQKSGATSGVDRIHTALHGYLRKICIEAGIKISESDSITKVFKKIRAEHPSFKDVVSRQVDIDRILNSLTNIMDALNPLRNKASVAHPNDILLDDAEAMLVINSANTILYYLNSKITT